MPAERGTRRTGILPGANPSEELSVGFWELSRTRGRALLQDALERARSLTVAVTALLTTCLKQIQLAVRNASEAPSLRARLERQRHHIDQLEASIDRTPLTFPLSRTGVQARLLNM